MHFLVESLRSIPIVAQSSYALIAYVIVVIAWAVIAWKVKRNKTLLENLQKFPRADRAKIVRAEMGITLRTGLSPEQWIRSQTHKYLFLGFLATASVILAIVLISALVKHEGRVSVDLTAPEDVGSTYANQHLLETDIRKAEDGGSVESTISATGAQLLMHYNYDSLNDRVTVRPSASFLEQRAKGGPVLEGFLDAEDPSENSFQWIAVKDFSPTVSVKAVNNSNQTIYISDALLRVNSSKVNYDPVLFFLSYHGPQFTIVNEGWGRVINPQLRFGFADAASCHETLTWSDEVFTKTLSTFLENTEVRVNDELPESYKDVDPVSGKTICLFGTLSYQTENNESRRLKLKVPIHIGGPRKFNGFGVSKSDAAYGIYLPPGESNYESIFRWLK